MNVPLDKQHVILENGSSKKKETVPALVINLSVYSRPGSEEVQTAKPSLLVFSGPGLWVVFSRPMIGPFTT